jgi:nitric oxide reductase NorQ protein
MEHKDIVLSPQIENMVNRALNYMQVGFPIHFIGPTGVGKTEIAFYLAKKLNRPLSYIQGNHEISNLDLIGGVSGMSKKKVIDNYIHSVYKSEEKVSEHWTDGTLLNAVKYGHTFIYDEFNRTKPETNNILLSVLQEKYLPLYGMKAIEKTIRVHPDFSIIFTSNPDEYTGSFKTQDALLDRMITFSLSHYDNETEATIIAKKTDIPLNDAKTITEIVRNVRSVCNKNKSQAPSLRSSIMIATIAKKNNINVSITDENFLTLCNDVLYFSLVKNQVSNMDLTGIINNLRRGNFEK